jgi:hypothetical protein
MQQKIHQGYKELLHIVITYIVITSCLAGKP